MVTKYITIATMVTIIYTLQYHTCIIYNITWLLGYYGYHGSHSIHYTMYNMMNMGTIYIVVTIFILIIFPTIP